MKSTMEGISYFMITAGVVGIVAPFFGLALRSSEELGSREMGTFLLIGGFALLGVISIFRRKGEQ